MANAKMFKTEKAARIYFAKLDEINLRCFVSVSNWGEAPLQCECCLRWTASRAYYGEPGGYLGAWCVYDSDNYHIGEAFEGICEECSDETSPESVAVAAALKTLNRDL